MSTLLPSRSLVTMNSLNGDVMSHEPNDPISKDCQDAFKENLSEVSVVNQTGLTTSFSDPILVTDQRQDQPEPTKEMHDLYQEVVKQKNQLLEERAHLVALLAKILPSGKRRMTIEGWSEDWNNCVYLDLRGGQISFHYRDDQAHLFETLPPYSKPYDGHDKATVLQRLKDELPRFLDLSDIESWMAWVRENYQLADPPKPPEIPADTWETMMAARNHTVRITMTDLLSMLELYSLRKVVAKSRGENF